MGKGTPYTDEFKQGAVNQVVAHGDGYKVYLCDPQGPWQHGTNENTKRLLRQYFPKKTDLPVHSRADPNKVAK